MYAENKAGDPAEIAELFEQYSLSRDKNVRNEIVMRSMHIVRYAVLSTRNMFKSLTDRDDVSGEAVMALMSAVDSFDPKKEVKFDTYASIKVRGAIIDYIRRMDMIPRGIRRFAKEYENAFSALCSQYEREPTKEEVAAYLGMSVEKMESCAAKSAAAQTLSFEELMYNGINISSAEDESGFYEAEKRIMMEERKSQLAEAITRLKDKERTVITLYYYEKLKYSEIAQVMGVSESRVCQIHTKATEKLRDILAEYIIS